MAFEYSDRGLVTYSTNYCLVGGWGLIAYLYSTNNS